MRGDPRRLPLWLALLLAGCSGPQSTLDPAGPSAASVHLLGTVMYVGATLVTLLVTALMLVPFLRRREGGVNARLFLWGGGVALPAVTVTALIPYVLTAGEEMRASTAPDRLSVDITGYVYWWEMSYRRAGGRPPPPPADRLGPPGGGGGGGALRAAGGSPRFLVPGPAGKTGM